MKTRLSSTRTKNQTLRALLCAAVAFSPAARAATFIWKGGAGSNSWTLNGNWTTSAPANDGTAVLTFTDTFFTGTDYVFPNLNVNYSIASLSFSGAKSFSLRTDAGATLTIGSGGLTQNSAAAQEIRHPVTLGAAQTWGLVNGAGTVNALGGIATAGNILSVNALGTNTLAGVISGTGGLTKVGAGTLSLTSPSTFTGATTVSAGTLTLPSGGSLTNTFVRVAPGAAITINGGSVDAGTAAYFGVGNATSATAAVANLLAGSLSTSETDVGNFAGSIATFTQSGGTHSVVSSLLLGLGTGSSGTYILGGAGSVLTTAFTEVGRVGLGLFTQTGGTQTVTGGTLNLGTMATGSGTYNFQGGQLFTTGTIVGLNGSGTFQQTGGTHTLGPVGLLLGGNAGSSGSYTLSGGTLQTHIVARVSGGGSFYFDGGVLQATALESNFLTGLSAAVVKTGGAKIDSNFAITIAQPLLHDSALGATLDGGLVKSGTGILTLRGANTYTGKTVVNAGTLQIDVNGSLLNSWVEVAPGGTFTIDGGSVNAGTGAYLVAGTAGSATAATVNVLAGSLSTAETDVGNVNGSIANFTQSGGTHTVDSGLYLGLNAGATGTYTLSGTGALSTLLTRVGLIGAGTFTQTGGTHTVGVNGLIIGRTATGSGSYLLQGGTLDTGAMTVGYAGAGIFTQSGGTQTLAGILDVALQTGSSGTYHLDGGIVQTARVRGGAGADTFNFNGGTLRAGANAANFFAGLNTAAVRAGGAKIDSNGFDITIAQPLAHDAALGATRDGGLVKSGAGTLTLSGAGTFTGKTIVTAGTLTIGTGGSLTNSLVEVNAGGTFTLNGGSVSAGAAAFFQVGNSTGSATGNLLAGAITSLETDIANVTGSAATFTHSGGTHTVAGGLYLAVSATSSASYTLSGAGSALSTNETNVGWRGAGAFTQNGGTHTTDVLALGSYSTSSGTYRLNGGTLKTHRITRTGGTGAFYFDGGTVELTASDSSFLTSTVTNYVGAGGAKIDTHGFDATISRPLVHDPALGSTADGGVTKSGAGTLTFTTSQTLSSLTISGGTVELGGAATAPAPFADALPMGGDFFGNAAAPLGGESFAQAVPEPGSLLLLLAALASLLAFRQRKTAAI